MSVIQRYVEYLLAHPELLQGYPEILAYAKAWTLDHGVGVIVRDKSILEKTDGESVVVIFNEKGCLGWVRGKEGYAKDWKMVFTEDGKEKVYIIPDNGFKPLNVDVFTQMKTWIAQNPLPVVQPSEVATPAEPLELVAEEIQEAEQHVKLHNVKKKDIIKKPKKQKAPKIKPDRSLRTVFKEHLSKINLVDLKKDCGWMDNCAIRLVETPEALQAWVDEVLADRGRWRKNVKGELEPVIAADCETIGLDNRIIVDVLEDGRLVYEIKAEIAGLCLASHADEGIYVPINHETGKCMKREDVRRILQPLLDRAHLIFYNGKFDREIMRLCLGLTLRIFPHFEDVQVLQYDNDPKADLDDQKKGKTFLSDAGGLKALSENKLGIKQMHLEALIKVKASVIDKVDCKCKHPVTQHQEKCIEKGCTCEKFVGKESLRVQYAPFNWLPTEIALWYAAADATCTWRLWEKTIYPARDRSFIHRIDHNLVDSITWIERQRFFIDVERHGQTVKWHQGKLRVIEAKLREIAEVDGWPVKRDDEGNAVESTLFNVNSGPQIGKLLFEVRKMPVVKRTEKGKPSTDADAMSTLRKDYPDDPFLTTLDNYKDYVSLHPENLRYDPKDHTARVYFRQNVVAGGRLAASGGEFDVDGGFELNPQGIKKPSGNWFVKGRILNPDAIPEDQVEPHEVAELHPTCRRGEDVAPSIIKNHIANYLGYSICLVPKCTTCVEKFGILIEDGRLDANEVLNLRCLFVSPPGWTLFSVDYSNIEMRAAANCSLEPKFIDEFLTGDADFHSLTAKNVFPEYSDPNTPKERKKALRALAKILNFALLYGGTEHAILENLKKENKDVPIQKLQEQADEMVQKFWEGVPKFFEYCEGKKYEAREGPEPKNEPVWNPDSIYHHGDCVRYNNGKETRVYTCLHKGLEGMKGGPKPDATDSLWMKALCCTTEMGRFINFVSAMEALQIHKPTDAEKKNYYQYVAYKKAASRAEESARVAKVNGNKDTYAAEKAAQKGFEDLAQQYWANEDTGVKNWIDYGRFESKIQRVAVNTPLQGLAGDFMRLSLNKICQLATQREPWMQSIFRLHATVHDEIVFSVKNEYVPWVMPRITRLMKLRRIHEVKKWPVPIECNIEYGGSWDVAHHVVGDKEHTPVAWTKIKGLENYIPDNFKEAVDPLLSFLQGDETRRAKAEAWMKRNFHEKVQKFGMPEVLKAKGDAIREAVTVAFQLDEYWTADHVADNKEADLETFLQYEARMGLGPQTRDPKYPPFGYLGTVPPDALVIRPTLEILNIPGVEAPVADPSTKSSVGSEVQPVPAMAPEAQERQQPLFRAVPTEIQAPVILKPLNSDEMQRLFNALGKGKGTHNIQVLCTNPDGSMEPGTIKKCTRSDVPEEFKAISCSA